MRRGDLYVADTRNNTIRTTAPMPSSLVVDFGPGYGLWIRRGTTLEPVAPVYGGGDPANQREDGEDALVIDFGPGVGLWFWVKETTATSSGSSSPRPVRRRW